MKNVRPVIPLKTALGITGFEKFNPAILVNLWKVTLISSHAN